MAGQYDLEDSTYDFSKQMSLRVATIILEDASEILRRRLKDYIYDEYTSLDKFFTGKAEKAILKSTLTKPQLDKIYPKTGKLKDLTGFDVTLSIHIIRVINNLTKTNSYTTEIDNLCRIRNKHLAHLSAMVFDENDYISLENCQRMNKPLSVLASLEKSIYDLCKDKNERVEFETRTKNHLEANIEPEKLESLRDKMTNLILNDREDVLQIVGMIQQKTGDTLKKQILDFETVYNQNVLQASAKLNRIIKSANKIDETIIKEMHSINEGLETICTRIENSDKTFKGMQSSISDLKENLNEVPQDLQFIKTTINTVTKSTESTERSVLDTKNTLSRVDCNLNTLSRNLESTPSNLQVIKSSISSLEKDVSNIEVTLNTANSFIKLSLADFKTFFTDEQNIYFKILILSANNVNNSLNKQEIANSLGGIDWNVIIDLDPDSRVRDKGFHDLLMEEMKKIHLKTYLPKTFDSLKDIDDQDLCHIYHGEWLLYILANGCKDVGVEVPKNFRVSSLKIICFLAKLYKHIQQKTLLCINFMMNEMYNIDCIGELNNIIDLNNDFYNSSDFLELEPKIFSAFVFDSSTKINYAYLDRNLSSKLKERYVCSGETNQILQAIKDCHLKKAVYHILLPGKENNISIDTNFYAQYSAFIELYHLDIGKIDEISDELLENQKESYLKGYEITPLQLYLDINHKIYVERDIVLEVHQKINDLLKQEHFFKKGSSRFIEVSAKLSSGTTTLVRALLFRFKNIVPCIRIKSIDQIDKIGEACLVIKRKCDLPVLILIDSSDFPNERILLEKVKFIGKQLDRTGTIRSIIIFTSREPYLFHENKNETINDEVITYNLTSELTKNETTLFKALYKEYFRLKSTKNDIESYIENFEGKSLVFWFGLMAFGKEFKNLHQLASHFIQKIEDDFKITALLYLVCFYNNFACHGFPLNLAAMRLGEKPCKLNKLLKSKEGDNYETLFNLFILKEITNSAKIHPIHSAIADEIMNYIVKSEEIHKKFEFFYEKFIELASLSASTYPEDLIEVTTILFVLKSQDESHHFSFLIEETEKCKGIEWMCKQLEEIHDRLKFIEPLAYSFGMLYARYLFHRMETKERGIEVLKQTLRIKDKIDESYKAPKFVVSQYLTQYGDFLRLTLKNTIANDENQLDQFISIAEEAIIAYRKAQKLPRGDPLKPYSEPSSRNISYNALAYIGECHTRNMLLDFYFKVICKKDKVIYTKALNDENTEEIIRNSENQIYDTIEKLDLLEKKGKLEGQGIKFNMYKMQIDLLERRVNLEEETFEDVMKNIKCRYPVYDTIKAIYTRKFGYKNVDWRLFQENMFEHIIVTCLERIKNSKQSFKDYEDLINAYIHSQRYSKFTTATYLEQATITAKEWKDKFLDEPEPYFYYGVLLLVSGIQNLDNDILKSANKNLETCKSIYESFGLKAAIYNYKEFQIGNKKHLQALLPSNPDVEDEDAENTLMRFEGRYQYKAKHVKLFNILPVYASQYGDNTMSEIEEKQENAYSFYLMIGRDRIYMFKRKRVQSIKNVKQ